MVRCVKIKLKNYIFMFSLKWQLVLPPKSGRILRGFAVQSVVNHTPMLRPGGGGGKSKGWSPPAGLAAEPIVLIIYCRPLVDHQPWRIDGNIFSFFQNTTINLKFPFIRVLNISFGNCWGFPSAMSFKVRISTPDSTTIGADDLLRQCPLYFSI